MTDLKFAFRQLLKNPGFTVVAVLTLALGIGACTAMFSLVRAVLLRPLPFRDSGKLVWIQNTGSGGMSAVTTRVDNFLDWRAQNQSFASLAAYDAFFDYNGYTLTGSGVPIRLRGVGVSQNLLDVLGVKPFLGRGFTAGECAWNGSKAVILSHAFWRQHFGGNPGVVGQAITINGAATEIVGVLPASFDFDAVFAPGTTIDFLLPFPLVEQVFHWGNELFAIGRLQPSVSIAQARSEFEVINQRLRATHPDRGTAFGARMVGLDEHVRGGFHAAFVILFVAVACVLLIACGNLSNLLLARANGRRKEFAVRVALGAGRWQLVRQTLTESLLLGICGCALGTPLAFLAIPSLAHLQAFSIPLLKTTTVDGTVLLFTILLSCLAGILCGVLPALQLSEAGTNERLNESNRGGSTGLQSASVRNTLVVSEVAVAVVLLVGAGLLIRSFVGLLEVNPGFDPAHTVAWRIDSPKLIGSSADAVRYYEELARKVKALPGVESVGLTDTLPLGRNREWGAKAKGETYPPGQYPVVFPRMVDSGYLQAMGIPLRDGRYFDARDTAGSEHVIVINETAAAIIFPGRSALGQIVRTGGGEWKVAGIAKDVRHRGLDEPPGAEMYQNIRQTGDWSSIDMVVRSPRPVDSLVTDVQAAMQSYDPDLPRTQFTTLEQLVDRSVAPRRLITELLGLFSGLGLILASLGLYGLIAGSVGQRRREIGVRMALGAQRGEILALVLGHGVKLTALGILIGCGGAVALTRVLRGLLYGVSQWDPATFLSIPLLLMLVAAAACYLPARRAANVNPMEALRNE